MVITALIVLAAVGHVMIMIVLRTGLEALNRNLLCENLREVAERPRVRRGSRSWRVLRGVVLRSFGEERLELAAVHHLCDARETT